MNRSTLCAGITIVLLSACSSTVPALPSCDADTATVAPFHELSSADWHNLTPDAVAERWPRPISWGSEASAERPCEGTATFSYLGRVVDNVCQCCDTFAFNDAPDRQKCSRYLSSVTLVRSAIDEQSARGIALRLLRAAGAEGTQLTLPYTTASTRTDAARTQVIQLQVAPLESDGGWRVRLLVYRTSTTGPND